MTSFAGSIVAVDRVEQKGKVRYTLAQVTNPENNSLFISRYSDPTAVVNMSSATIIPMSLVDPAVRADAVKFATSSNNGTLLEILDGVARGDLKPLAELPVGVPVNIGRGITVTLSGSTRAITSFRNADPKYISSLVEAAPQLKGGSVVSLGVVTLENPTNMAFPSVVRLPKTARQMNGAGVVESRNLVNTVAKSELATIFADLARRTSEVTDSQASSSQLTTAIRAPPKTAAVKRMSAQMTRLTGAAANASALASINAITAGSPVQGVYSQVLRTSAVSSTRGRNAVRTLSSIEHDRAVGPLASPQRPATLSVSSRAVEHANMLELDEPPRSYAAPMISGSPRVIDNVGDQFLLSSRSDARSSSASSSRSSVSSSSSQRSSSGHAAAASSSKTPAKSAAKSAPKPAAKSSKSAGRPGRR